MNKYEKHIIFCNCKGERIPPDKLSDLREFLDKLPFRVTIISDICGVSAIERESIAEILGESKEYLVLGCYPRTMRLLLDQAGGHRNKEFKQNFVNLIDSSSADIKESISRFCSDSISNTSHNEICEQSGWPSWYPVIDYDRCTACGQCADFCLFGVYEKTSEKVTVVNPQGCKNQCPACGRICPSTAIIFPKYKNGGAIGGSDEIDERAEQQRQAQDIETLLGNDIYHSLQKRKIKRQSIIREESMKKALDERDNFLNENKLS